MGNSCCSTYSKNDEAKTESIHAPLSSKRASKDKNQDFVQETFLALKKEDTMIDMKNSEYEESESFDKIPKNAFKRKYSLVCRLGLSKALIKNQKEEEKLLTIINKKKFGCSDYFSIFLSKNSNILHPIFDVFEDSENFFIVSDNSSEEKLLDSYFRKGNYSETEISKYIKSLCEEVLNSNLNFLFINPLELLVFDNYKLKIVPFSIPSLIFSSPEQISNNFDKKSIVWNIGVLIYTMLCGYPPFKGDLKVSISKGLFNFTGNV